MLNNHSIIFADVPDGLPIAGKHLVVADAVFDDTAQPPSGGLIIELCYLSLDPYQRQRMIDEARDIRNERFTLGQPIDNFAIATVLSSDIASLAPGDCIGGFFPFSQYAFLDKTQAKEVKKLDNPHDVEVKHFLGALGMPGITAYASFYEIGKPKMGQTIFISAASGAVGQVVGLRVLGSVGSDEKLDFIIDKLGFDDGFNYKKEAALDALKRLAPRGLDIYYDNVGGEQLDAALLSANHYSRFVLCGMVAQYSDRPGEQYGLENMLEAVERRITLRGFISTDEDMGAKYTKEHRDRIGRWIKDGSFVTALSETKGIEDGPDAIMGMLQGKNFGKTVLVVKELF